jgi:hypothetical protein
MNTCKRYPTQKKLTITVDTDVYDGLHAVIGRRKISRFLSDLARPHVVGKDLRAGYAAMAADETRESEASEWAESLVGDVADEPRRHG